MLFELKKFKEGNGKRKHLPKINLLVNSFGSTELVPLMLKKQKLKFTQMVLVKVIQGLAVGALGLAMKVVKKSYLAVNS